jgi:hypothetical protein
MPAFCKSFVSIFFNLVAIFCSFAILVKAACAISSGVNVSKDFTPNLAPPPSPIVPIVIPKSFATFLILPLLLGLAINALSNCSFKPLLIVEDIGVTLTNLSAERSALVIACFDKG